MWCSTNGSMCMIRVLRILRCISSALCLFLFLGILVFWRGTGPTARVIWWNHSDPLPYYHLATIRNGCLELGVYRETSLGSMSIQSLTRQFERTCKELEEQSRILDDLVATINPQ